MERYDYEELCVGYIVMLRARMFRSLIIRTGIKERNIRARNIRYNLCVNHAQTTPIFTNDHTKFLTSLDVFLN